MRERELQEFAARYRHCMDEVGLTPAIVAQRTGMTATSVRNWLRAWCLPRNQIAAIEAVDKTPETFWAISITLENNKE